MATNPISDATQELLEESIDDRGIRAPVLRYEDGQFEKAGDTDGEPSPGWLEQVYLEDPFCPGLMLDGEGRLWLVDVRPHPSNDFAKGTPERTIVDRATEKQDLGGDPRGDE